MKKWLCLYRFERQLMPSIGTIFVMHNHCPMRISCLSHTVPPSQWSEFFCCIQL
ncbi:hypothetical protein Gogos_019181 [Gossypium gossypioides]|uniref:Uncharacterized protein n=1 Tax=Gossypium gossypioides TaxID=34282 RepID=A0A7J9BGN8_GOSGO|nr:hypothetical protein [Gossypium gossypioides]